MTSDYCSHTTTIDAAISILKTGQLLSAVKAFGRDAEELVWIVEMLHLIR